MNTYKGEKMQNTKSQNHDPIDWVKIRETDKVLRAGAGIAYELGGLSFKEKQIFFDRTKLYLEDLGKILWDLRGEIKIIRSERPASPYNRPVPLPKGEDPG